MSDALINASKRVAGGFCRFDLLPDLGSFARFRPPPVADAAEVRHNSERSFVELTGLSTPLR